MSASNRRLPRSAARLAIAAVAAIALSACGGETGLAAIAPHYQYGFVTSVEGSELCLDEARADEPDRERCFDIAEVDTSAEVERGAIVKVRYVEEGEDETAVAREVEVVRPAVALRPGLPPGTDVELPGEE